MSNWLLLSVVLLVPTAAAAAGVPKPRARVSTETAIDLSQCDAIHGRQYLPFGHAWWVVAQSGLEKCEVWLGGETENPRYRGETTQYCSFPRKGMIAITYGSGGPARISAPNCRSTEFPALPREKPTKEK